MKILNAYAGLGGNRKKWNEVKKDIEVYAVEKDESVADFYKSQFPNDMVIVGDAHRYIRKHHKKFDFIWTSPPCPTHSRMNTTLVGRGQIEPRYVDCRLYQEIDFLRQWFGGLFIVENVIPYYQPWIPYDKKLERHLFWSNVRIGNFKIEGKKPFISREQPNFMEDWQNYTGFDLTGWKFEQRKDKLIKNCVHPDLGKYLFQRILGIAERPHEKQQSIKFE